MFGGYTELRNAMGPEPGMDTKNSPAKTTRSLAETDQGNETLGVCARAFKTNALFPLTRPTSLEMSYWSARPIFVGVEIHKSLALRVTEKRFGRTPELD